MGGIFCPWCGHARDTLDGPCPHCGRTIDASDEPPEPGHQLPRGTVLQNRYEITNVLGEGGFGITYRGHDRKLDADVAIKEYFPVGTVTRNVSVSLTVSRINSNTQSYLNAIENFLQEARALARMRGNPAIVNVMDVFEENGTAYIVMEYVHGSTLLQLTKERGGRIEPHELLPLIEPVVLALSELHARGLVHRDISPDNILIGENGSARLIDFGCAREGTDGIMTTRIMLKYDYAPLEQYSQVGQGSWTDVYGLCATIYRCLCGVAVPQAVRRVSNDSLVPPTEMGVPLLPTQEEGLLHGLAVQPDGRTRTIAELYEALYESADDENAHLAKTQRVARVRTTPLEDEKPAEEELTPPEEERPAEVEPAPVEDEGPTSDEKPAEDEPVPMEDNSALAEDEHLTEDKPAEVPPETADTRDDTNRKGKKRPPFVIIGAAAVAIALAVGGMVVTQQNGGGTDTNAQAAIESDSQSKAETKNAAKVEDGTKAKDDAASKEDAKSEDEGDPNSPFQLNDLSKPKRTDEEHERLLAKAKSMLPTADKADTTVLDFGTFAGTKRFSAKGSTDEDGYTVYEYRLKGDVQDGFDVIAAYYDVMSTCFATIKGKGASSRYMSDGHPRKDFGFNYDGTGKGVHDTSFTLGDPDSSTKTCEILLQVTADVAKESLTVKLHVPDGLTLLSAKKCTYNWYLDAISAEMDSSKEDSAKEETTEETTDNQQETTSDDSGSDYSGGDSGTDYSGGWDSGTDYSGGWGEGDWDSGSSSGSDWGSGDWDAG